MYIRVCVCVTVCDGVRRWFVWLRSGLAVLYDCLKRPITMSKETYYNVKRDLLQCQKRPVTGSKSFVLYDCLKRPITMSKETYYNVKRDLLQCQKRPITGSKSFVQEIPERSAFYPGTRSPFFFLTSPFPRRSWAFYLWTVGLFYWVLVLFCIYRRSLFFFFLSLGYWVSLFQYQFSFASTGSLFFFSSVLGLI